jgi:hypothetical protein
MPDSEKDWWRARHVHRAAEHAPPGAQPHPREACEDEARIWFPQLTVCRAEMETAAAEAMFARLHEKRPWHDGTFTDWAAEPSADHPYHYSYGTRIWVTGTDLGLGGNFTTQENPYATDDEEGERGHSA